MRVVWAMLCESFVQDQHTNKLSIFNTVEGLNVSTLALPPTAPEGNTIVSQPFNLLATIVRSDFGVGEQGSAWVTMIEPAGGETARPEIPVNLLDFPTYRIWVYYQGLPVTSGGVYKFRVECRRDDGELGESFEFPLLVHLVSA